MEHSTLNLLNSVYTKWVPRPLTAMIIVSLSEGRHIDLRSSTFDHRPSIFDLQPSTIDPRPSIIDLRIDLRPSIFEHRSSNTVVRRSKVETSHRQSNIALTIRHRILSTTALHMSVRNFIYKHLERSCMWTIFGDEL